MKKCEQNAAIYSHALLTGAVGEGGPAHPDDTLRGTLLPRWRTGSPWLLDRSDEEAGREEHSSLIFDLQ